MCMKKFFGFFGRFFKGLGRFLFKHRTFFVWVILFAGLGMVADHFYNVYLDNQDTQAKFNEHPKRTFKDGTSTSPAFYSTAAFNDHLLKDYSFIYNASIGTSQTMPIGQNYVVPGLYQTKTYNVLTHKMESAYKMTPQGLTVAGDYVLISAYDGDYIHASVIYVIDKKTGKFIKTIQLKGRPHVGGLAYDPIGKNVWVTGSMNEEAILASISLKKITKYKYSKEKEPIKYDEYITLPTVQKASTVTYFDNQLFVGFFNAHDKGSIASFTISRDGKQKNSITNDMIQSTTGELTMSNSTGETAITNQIQGIAVTSDRIFLTQSYGGYDAKLYIYPISAINNLTEGNAERIIPLPPYLEQIYIEGNQMLALFESGSKMYARDTILVMDRVLALNINALLN